MRTSLHGALARLELPDLAEAGFACALRDLVAGWRMQGQVRPALHCDVTGDLSGLPVEPSVALYPIAQELLTNALRHGRPSRVFLRLERAGTGARTVLTVDDDGGGDVARTATSAGRGIRACATLPADAR